FQSGSKFKGTYYNIFVATAVPDLIMVLATFHDFRLTYYPEVNGMFAKYQCEACSTARIALSYICPSAQDLLNTFLSLSRLTSIVFPLQHAKIWKWLLPISISFSYLLAAAMFSTTFTLFVFPNLLNCCAFQESLLHPFPISHLYRCNTALIIIIEMGVTSVIIIVLYAMAGRGLRRL
ncbi:hypothetical protein PMAYCL1PPCAC_20553, partial [Pristionchus mayeri]